MTLDASCLTYATQEVLKRRVMMLEAFVPAFVLQCAGIMTFYVQAKKTVTVAPQKKFAGQRLKIIMECFAMMIQLLMHALSNAIQQKEKYLARLTKPFLVASQKPFVYLDHKILEVNIAPAILFVRSSVNMTSFSAPMELTLEGAKMRIFVLQGDEIEMGIYVQANVPQNVIKKSLFAQVHSKATVVEESHFVLKLRWM